jgi:transposase-like protein
MPQKNHLLKYLSDIKQVITPQYSLFVSGQVVWQEEHKSWSKRDLERKHYVYIWADGVYFNIRSEEARWY